MKTVFLGAPGVGKGTYTQRVVERYNIVHISTGDIFRENIKNKTELGKEAKSYIDNGDLVPDEVTINMVKDRLSKDDVNNGYVLDGFPRTTKQAEALEGFESIDVVVNFEADQEVIMQRLSGRRICDSCGATYHVENMPPQKEGVCDKCEGNLYQREDDKPESIKKRLEKYEEETAPLKEFYEKRGLLKTVDANSSNIDSVVQNVFSVLDQYSS